MLIAPLLAAILPNLPALKQMLTKPKTFTKEAASGGIGYALYLIYSDYATCGGIECVTSEHWGVLVSAAIVLVTRLNAKRKEA